MGQKKNNSHWEISGYYPSRILSGPEYDSSTIFTESKVNGCNIKLIECAQKELFTVTYADLVNSGKLTATWNGQEPYVSSRQFQQHDGFEFMFVLSGASGGNVEHQPFMLRTGDCLLVNTHSRIYYDSYEELRCLSISMTHDFVLNKLLEPRRLRALPEIFASYFQRNLQDIRRDKNFVFYHYCGNDLSLEGSYLYAVAAFDELRNKEPCFEDALIVNLIRFMAALIGSADYEREANNILSYSPEELAAEMKNYADQAKCRISRQQLTERFHFNSDYLCKVFKEKIGQTFRAYNENVYIHEAHRLICEEKSSVTEASERVGFSSRAQFYKVYRKYFPTSG